MNITKEKLRDIIHTIGTLLISQAGTLVVGAVLTTTLFLQ